MARQRKNRTNRGSSHRAETGQAIVNSHSKGWLRKGFDWVYDNEILAIDPKLKPGQEVKIVGEDRKPLGIGILDSEHIRIRRLSDQVVTLDKSFYIGALSSALQRRLIPKETTAWRWVHGENDDLAGIRVDVWGVEAALILESASMLGQVEPLVEAMVELFPLEAVWLSVRHPKGDRESLGCIWGTPEPHGLVVYEHGLQYLVHPERSVDAGLFCDMREMRQFLKPYCLETSVLNLFCYTGAFSVSALAHGAKEVTSVDLSKNNIQRLEDNLRLNGLGEDNHTSIADDCFAVLDKLRRQGKTFDLVIADPPSYSNSSHGTWSVEQHLGRLVAAALRVTKPGGRLVVATNHGQLTPKDFIRSIVDGATRTQRRIRIIHQYSPPSDFPAAIHFPESRYLKCWCLQT